MIHNSINLTKKIEVLHRCERRGILDLRGKNKKIPDEFFVKLCKISYLDDREVTDVIEDIVNLVRDYRIVNNTEFDDIDIHIQKEDRLQYVRIAIITKTDIIIALKSTTDIEKRIYGDGVSIDEDLFPNLVIAYNDIKGFLELNDHRNITITGHALGGHIAQFLGIMFTDYKRVKVKTFNAFAFNFIDGMREDVFRRNIGSTLSYISYGYVDYNRLKDNIIDRIFKVVNGGYLLPNHLIKYKIPINDIKREEYILDCLFNSVDKEREDSFSNNEPILHISNYRTSIFGIKFDINYNAILNDEKHDSRYLENKEFNPRFDLYTLSKMSWLVNSFVVVSSELSILKEIRTTKELSSNIENFIVDGDITSNIRKHKYGKTKSVDGKPNICKHDLENFYE